MWKSIKFLLTYWRLISIILASITLIITVGKLIINSASINRIQNNEIKHIQEDIKNLKKENKDYKVDLKKELGKIFRRLGKIEKIQYAQQKICDERHKNIKDK